MITFFIFQMKIVEGSSPFPSDRTMALLSFENKDQAAKWAAEADAVKDAGWLGGAGIISVPVAGKPGNVGSTRSSNVYQASSYATWFN